MFFPEAMSSSTWKNDVGCTSLEMIPQVSRPLLMSELSSESSTVQNRAAYHWRPFDRICPGDGSRNQFQPRIQQRADDG